MNIWLEIFSIIASSTAGIVLIIFFWSELKRIDKQIKRLEVAGLLDKSVICVICENFELSVNWFPCMSCSNNLSDYPKNLDKPNRFTLMINQEE